MKKEKFYQALRLIVKYGDIIKQIHRIDKLTRISTDRHETTVIKAVRSMIDCDLIDVTPLSENDARDKYRINVSFLCELYSYSIDVCNAAGFDDAFYNDVFCVIPENNDAEYDLHYFKLDAIDFAYRCYSCFDSKISKYALGLIDDSKTTIQIVRAISEKFNVSENTARNTLKELQNCNLVRMHQSKKTFTVNEDLKSTLQFLHTSKFKEHSKSALLYLKS